MATKSAGGVLACKQGGLSGSALRQAGHIQTCIQLPGYTVVRQRLGKSVTQDMVEKAQIRLAAGIAVDLPVTDPQSVDKKEQNVFRP
jgi:hypothetical protein